MARNTVTLLVLRVSVDSSLKSAAENPKKVHNVQQTYPATPLVSLAAQYVGVLGGEWFPGGESPPPPLRRGSSLERGIVGAPPPLVRDSDHRFTAAEVEGLLAVRDKEVPTTRILFLSTSRLP